MAKQLRLNARVLQDGVLMLFGIVGDDWMGFTAANVVQDLHALEDGERDPIRVLLNSPGGSVFEGLAIYNELKTHSSSVELEIPGVAASAASMIAMAADRVTMGPEAHIMIHDPWMVEAGNSEALRRAAELLDRFGTSLANIYAERTGLPEAEIREMMARYDGDGTWLTAAEAVEMGFADEVVAGEDEDEEDRAAAFAGLDVSDLPNVPDRVVALIKEGQQMTKQPKGSEKDPVREPQNEPQPKGVEPQPQKTEPTDPSVAIGDAIRAERERASAIRALADRFPQLPKGFAEDHVAKGTGVTEFSAALTDKLAEIQDAVGGPGWVPPGVGVITDEQDKMLKGMENWLLVKAGHQRTIERHTKERPEPGGFRGFKLIDLARECLELRGTNTRRMSPHDIARLALVGGPRAEQAGLGTRSDFPVLLENVLHKLLLAQFELAPDQWRNVAATGSVSDFREHRRLKLGSMSRLDDLLESGEFKQTHFPDADRERIKAETYGNIVGLTRQSIVNDDLAGFERMVTMLGRAAARSIEIDVFALFEENAGLGPTMEDTEPLFDATHNNIQSSSNEGTPSQARMEDARILMAQQQDPDENDYLDLRPAVFVGPIGLGADVRETIGAQYSDLSEDDMRLKKPNVVRDLLDTVVDTPRLTGDRWYLLANPIIAPTFEVVFLDGQESPRIEVEEGFDYDGIRWKIAMDYGTGAIEWRTATTNAGA